MSGPAPDTALSSAVTGVDIVVSAMLVGPLFVAALIGLTPRRWITAVVACGAFLVTVAVAILGVLLASGRGPTAGAAVGGWSTPLGIAIVADGPAGLMTVMTASVLVGAGLYLRVENGPFARSPTVWATLFFLWSGLNALFLTADLFTAYVALEITGLAGVALISLSGTVKSLTAQMRYLLVATGASLIYLMGVALVYAVTGRLDGPGLDAASLPPDALLVASAGLALMTLGLLIKMAAWPFHFWLPPAHAGSIPPISAILSALVVKAAALFLVRLWTGPFLPVLPSLAPTFIGVLGACAIIWGSVQALRQMRLKPIIAYSTVAQLGYLLVAVPIIIAGSATDAAIAAEAWAGALIHALSHGLAKAALFLAVGSIIVAAGSDHLRVLVGATRSMPIAIMTIAIAGASIMGLPPSAGFLGKWLLLRAAISSGSFWWAIPIVLGGFLAAAYMFRILTFAFRTAPQFLSAPTVNRRPELETIALVLALATIAAGLAGGLLSPLISLAPGWSIGAINALGNAPGNALGNVLGAGAGA